MHRTLTLALAALVTAVVLAAPAAAEVPANADWHEFYIADELPYPAGEPTLHADLLVPKGTDLTKDKLPIIVSAGPYFAHAGSGPGETPNNDGPQLRWNDLIVDGQLFERGYGLLQVDLRGFGASQGCNDFGGRGEQIDTKRAVEWAAAQPWSLGDVAIFGKSYDGWTGVMALDEKPEGLGAAIIQSPIIDGYRTLYQDGVHYNAGWYATPGLYQATDAIPPAFPDITNGRVEYIAGWATGTNPACYALNIALQDGLQKRDDALGFWRERDLDAARGSDVPTFWSHGFLDVNTKPDNFESVWSTLTGHKRAWFGQFAHTRPNEPGVGRHPFYYEEMFDFLDEHLRGEPRVEAPTVEVEDSDGRWRAEQEWPPADGVGRDIALRSGTYTDRPGGSGGVWSITDPLTNDAWIAGVPTAKVDVTTQLPDANVVAQLWDIAPDGSALLISRGAGKYTGTGAGTKSLELYPADYVVHAGHRLGVFVNANDSLYLPPPSLQDVSVSGGTLTAPFLTHERTAFLQGERSADSDQRPERTVSAETIGASPTTWDEPDALTPTP
jgi:predicted acyl esterase